jgi:hypothetical protein
MIPKARCIATVVSRRQHYALVGDMLQEPRVMLPTAVEIGPENHVMILLLLLAYTRRAVTTAEVRIVFDVGRSHTRRSHGRGGVTLCV